MQGSLLTVDDFLLDAKDLGALQLPPWEPKGVAKKEPSYERQHAELFLSEGWEWPLQERHLIRDCGPSLLSLSQRAREVAYAAHMKWQMPVDVEACTLHPCSIPSSLVSFVKESRGCPFPHAILEL